MTKYLSDQVIFWFVSVMAHMTLLFALMGVFLAVVLMLGGVLRCFHWAVSQVFLVPVLFEALSEAKRQGRAPWATKFMKHLGHSNWRGKP